ncbi:hypothetical protein [Neorhizobium galegae]|uniref:hypothetical protein n=1 Tax=Neorhizobium galegae TaxID=399 RepID=UPI001F2D3C87|nr:hypothetical protein [Neorhizobium galegae]UIK08991.1 hypothetical protein LZK81_28750 [Neorhizobium galegae]
MTTDLTAMMARPVKKKDLEPKNDGPRFPKYPREVRFEKLRDMIELGVLMGRLTPEKAERRAKKFGLAPFASVPAKISFDGLPDLWTPEMVATWIATKDPTRVIRHHFESCQSSAIWVRNMPGRYHSGTADLLSRAAPSRLFKPGSIHAKGYSKVSLTKTSLFDSYYDFDGELCAFPKFHEWFQEVKELLAADQICSWGMVSEEDPGRKIRPDEWPFASFRQGGNGRAILYVGSAPVYVQIFFLGSEILEKFSSVGSQYRAWRTDTKALRSLSLSRRILIASMQKSEKFALGFPINRLSKKDLHKEIWDCITDADLKKKYEVTSDAKFYNFISNAFEAYFEEKG